MDQLAELSRRIDRVTPLDGVHATAIPRLRLIRASAPTDRLGTLHAAALCIIVQGSKKVMLGDRVYTYNPSKYLVISVDVPIIGQVTRASRDEPYLCMRVDIDPASLCELALELGVARTPLPAAASVGLSAVTPELLDAVLRLVRLLEVPRDIPILAPLAEREILYRLLTGDQGPRLGQIAHADSKLAQINRAIGWIKLNYTRSFNVETVARKARMSPSALYQHFKRVTAMSPLQYQKELRLQEARRLILSHSLDAATAAHSVGYESASQFNREYRRMFGEPPRRDVERLRTLSLGAGESRDLRGVIMQTFERVVDGQPPEAARPARARTLLV